MRPLWIAVDSKPDETRVLATAGPQEMLLKARLSPAPHHRRAVLTLFEALAMWQGTQARAVVVVGHRDRLDGFGPFHDLRQLVMFEVAR